MSFLKILLIKIKNSRNQNKSLQLRKAGTGAGVEINDTKKFILNTSLDVPKDPLVKLSPELLSKLDSIVYHPPVDNKIPSASYLDGLSEFDIVDNDDPETIQNYLEKKYLSQDFRFHKIGMQHSVSAYSPNLKFENNVNNILSDHSIDYKWYFYIHSFIDKIINTIRPNANRPNEVVNYTEYVTVRSIQWKDHLK
jgi:hypothetical protein